MWNKKTISIILVVLSFLWILAMIYRDIEGISQIFAEITPQSLLLLVDATIFVCIGVVLLVPLFEIIVRQNTQRHFPLRYLARLFFAGQIVSYLPGRLLGTAYLINETQKIIPALSMIRINIELILTIILFNTFTAVSIMALYFVGKGIAVIVFLMGIVIFVVYHRMNLFDLLLHFLAKILPKKMSAKVTDTKTHRPFSYETIGLMILIFLIHWVAYLKAWACLEGVFTMLDGDIVLLLAAAYTLSWLIGFITMITPGGLGVREVSFVLLSSKHLSKNHASFLSLFLRIWLIFVDLLLFLISLAILKAFPCRVEEMKKQNI